jgi:manganese/zinc/iron transport system permease protein
MTQADVYVILAAAAACLALIALFYKEFQLVSFDAEFAQALGWPVYGVDLLLMSLVAAAVVIGLPSVGVILVSALLIMPGAAARFWTDRLGTLLLVAGGFGFAMGFIGTLLSARFANLPTGPIIVLTGTAIFGASLLFGWRRGAIARLSAHLRFQRRWRQRQLLRTMYDVLEAGGTPQSGVRPSDLLARRAWTPAQLEGLLNAAAADNLLVRGERIALTPAGARQAALIARGQRLWEKFLTEYPEQAGGALNLASDSLEDFVPPATVAELTSQLMAEGRWPGEEGRA